MHPASVHNAELLGHFGAIRVNPAILESAVCASFPCLDNRNEDPFRSDDHWLRVDRSVLRPKRPSTEVDANRLDGQ